MAAEAVGHAEDSTGSEAPGKPVQKCPVRLFQPSLASDSPFFVRLEATVSSDGRCSCEQGRAFFVSHRAETARDINRLSQSVHRIAPGYNETGWKGHGIAQAFGCGYNPAAQDCTTAHGLHTEHADVVLYEHRKH